MSKLRDLEDEADLRRAAFFDSLGRARKRLTVRKLADEAMGMADPDLKLIKGLQRASRRNPLLALAAVISAQRLFTEALQAKEIKHGRQHKTRNGRHARS